MSALVEKSSNRIAQTLRQRHESGMSLASIAIGLVIAGLIAATAVKGIEVFRKSQTNASFVDIQRLAAAYDNFTLRYSAVPGDLGQAAELLPPCAPGSAAPACPSGDGDGTIDRVGAPTNSVTLASAVDPAADRETTLFWYHMQASGLFSALIDTSLPTTILAFGQNLPTAEAGGGYRVRVMNTATEKGLFVIWQADATTDARAAGSQVLRAVDTAYLDQKYDDGDPTTGSVRAISGAVNTCTSGGFSGPGVSPYQTGANLQSCALAIKIAEPVGATSVAMAINNACTPLTDSRSVDIPCPVGPNLSYTPGVEERNRICPMGIWTPWVLVSAPVCVPPPPPPPLINGVCAAVLFTCTDGTVANTNVPASTWDCLGSGGGADASCSVAGPPPPPGTCGADVHSWTVGADTCIANSVAGTVIGSNQGVTDATAPTTGSATFECLAGGVWAAAPNAGATCTAPPPPPGTCGGTTHSWTVGGKNCTADSVAGTVIGSNQSVTDGTAPNTGSATFECLAGGVWAAAPNAGATCNAPPPPPPTDCPRDTHSWTVGGKTCIAISVAGTLIGSNQSVTDGTAPNTGSATFECLAGGVWAAAPNAGATCAAPTTCGPVFAGFGGCEFTTVAGNVGDIRNLVDNTLLPTGYMGSLTLTCEDQGFGPVWVQSAQICNQHPVCFGPVTWTVGGNTCDGNIADGITNDFGFASDASGPTTGSANFQCVTGPSGALPWRWTHTGGGTCN